MGKKKRSAFDAGEKQEDQPKHPDVEANVPFSDAADSSNGELENEGDQSLAPPIEVSLANPHDVAMRTLAGFLGLQHDFLNPPSRLKKEFKRPFLATERTLDKLNRIAVAELSRLAEEDVRFLAEVTLGGAESETFCDLDSLFKSTNRLPNSLTLDWQVVQADPVSRYNINIAFETGASQLWSSFKSGPANIILNVSGREKDWCIVAKHKLEEQLELTRVPTLYRWLQIFENETVCLLGSYLIAILLASVVWSVSFSYEESKTNQEFLARREQMAKEEIAGYRDVENSLIDKLKVANEQSVLISGMQAIEEKASKAIEFYYQSRIGDLEESIADVKESAANVELPNTEPAEYFTGFVRRLTPYFLGMVAIFSGLSVGQKLLPLLSPRSGIAIGEAASMYADWENTFKFIVFTVLICGMLVPLIRAFVG